MLRYHSKDRNLNATIANHHFPPISRTVRYKKFTKPLLERKRRARMNKCLDELKLLVGTLEAEGENINKLEKADILELTVRYVKRISRLQDPVEEAHRFQAGFSQCAREACKFLLTLPGLNSAEGHRLVDHLQQCIVKPRPVYQIPREEAISQQQQQQQLIRLNVQSPSSQHNVTEQTSSNNSETRISSPCTEMRLPKSPFLSQNQRYQSNQSFALPKTSMRECKNLVTDGICDDKRPNNSSSSVSGSNSSDANSEMDSTNPMWRPW